MYGSFFSFVVVVLEVLLVLLGRSIEGAAKREEKNWVL